MQFFKDFDQDEEDNESFKSAIEFPITESFTAYSHHVVCINDFSPDIDLSSHDSDFEDANSEEYSDLDESPPEEWNGRNLERERQHPSASSQVLGNKNGEGNILPVVKNDRSREERRDVHRMLDKGSVPMVKESSSSSSSSVNPNLAAQIIKSMSFNQDRDCLALALSKGIQIRTMDDLTKSHVHKLDIKGGTNCIQVLHRTSLVAVTKSRTPRIVSLIYAKNGNVLKDLSFTSAVRRIEMNRLCMVILTASGELHIFVLEEGKRRQGIRFLASIGLLHKSESSRIMTAEGASLQGSFFDLASHATTDGESWLVAKSMEGVGYVSVYKITWKSSTAMSSSGNSVNHSQEASLEKPAIKLVNTVCAHNHSISKIALCGMSHSSTTKSDLLFATTSVKGTLIRVFRLSTCEKLYEFQRGSSPCTIHSLAFNSDATTLSVSGSKGTVHLFRLNDENRVQAISVVAAKSNTLQSLWNRILASAQRNHSESHIVRSFARIRLKGEYARMPNIVTLLAPNQEEENGNVEENVVICLLDGTLIQYAVNYKGKKRPVRAEKLLTRTDAI